MELPEEAVRNQLAAELSRRDFVRRAGGLGLGALVLGALPVAARLAGPEPAIAQNPAVNDGTLQAFWDTIIPGKAVPDLKTELGNPIHPQAIAGADFEHGAVYADSLLLARNPKIGFSALEPAFLAELEDRSLPEGGQFLDLGYEARERVCVGGLDFGNATRAVWEAAAAVAFTAFCAAANVVNATGRPGRERTAAGYVVRWRVQGVRVDPETKQPAGAIEEIECKVLILSAGAMGTPPILMRSRENGALPSISPHLGRHLGVNGDHVAAIELNPRAVREVLDLPGYDEFFKGKPITTMTYDFWAGKGGSRHNGTRFTLQEILLSPLTNFLYDDGRGAEIREPSWWGRAKKRAISAWDRRIEILAMVEDTHDGEFFAVPPGGGGHVQPNPGPVGIGLFSYRLSPQSTRIREQADEAIGRIAERRGVGRFMKLTETQGAYASHPLGGCRMADEIGFGVTDHRCEAFGNEGLFCMDSSAIPTSLGVNPSLTIAAVCERAAAVLVERAADYGLPAPPPGFRHRVPAEIVGPRVHP